MKASDFVAAFLAANGVSVVAEMCGGMTTHLLDSLSKRDDIRVVSMHHEQAAGFAAEAIARMTGVPGIAMATSGPGATNLITAIGSCYFDSVPAVFITGQVNTHELRGESGVRQAGFQETDIVAVATPITKAAWQVASSDELPCLLEDAFRLACEGRPGPVLLDIPMNVQRGEIAAPIHVVSPAASSSVAGIDALLAELRAASRPLLLVGGGVRTAGAAELLRDLATRTHTPVVSSLMGLDALGTDHPERVGLIGSYGNRWANLAMAEADLLVVLGARLDVRQTGADTGAFAAGKRIIRVDVDPSQIGWRVPSDLVVQADLRDFLLEALGRLGDAGWDGRGEWHARIAGLAAAWPDDAETADIGGINPASFLRTLSEKSREIAAFVTDVGQNQMWAAQSVRLRSGQRFLTSGGMGAMGFALPAAIGAALAQDAPVVMISGDGGMQVNIQELETVARLRLPVKMVVMDNRCLGMVRQFQDEYFESRRQSTVWGYGSPDFSAVATAFGLPSQAVESPDEVERAIDWLLADSGAPALLHVRLSQESCVRPKVSFGNPVYVMDAPPGEARS